MSSRPGYRIGRDPNGITDQQRAIKALLDAGFSGPQTAEKLGLSRQRVSQAMRDYRKKMAAAAASKEAEDGQDTE